MSGVGTRIGLLELVSLCFLVTGSGAQTTPPAAQPSSTAVATVGWDSGCAPNGAQLKAAVDRLRPAYPDETEFLRALTRAVGLAPGIVDDPTITLPTSTGLTISVVFPFPGYALRLSERIRAGGPLSDVPVASDVAVVVSRARSDAPNITKLAVERDGQRWEPSGGALAAADATPRPGARSTVDSGTVTFPCAAFAPGSTVVLTAVRDPGTDMVFEIPPLVRIRYWSPSDAAAVAFRARQASSLLGLTADAVRKTLGPPPVVDGRRWTYPAKSGSLVVYLNQADIVWDVQPPTYDLERRAAGGRPGTEAPASAPVVPSDGQFGTSIDFDTAGVEFGPWVRRLLADLRRGWFIPSSAMDKVGHVVTVFRVHKDGSISDVTLNGSSGIVELDEASRQAVMACSPTQPLPAEYPRENATFTVTFYYNEYPGRPRHEGLR